MATSLMRQITIVLMIWLRSYHRAPMRLFLVAISIAASALTFIIGWNLGLALDHARPAAPDNAYMLLAAGAVTEARSLIALSTYTQLRTEFSASPMLRHQVPQGALVLPADIVIDAHRQERLPTLLRGVEVESGGNLAGLALISGRYPVPGQRELVLSPALNAWLRARQPSDMVKLARRDWRVVGVARRAGADQQVEMYSTLSALQQQFQIVDFISSISLTLEPSQLAEVRQFGERLKGSRLELQQLNTYGSQFIDLLHAQVKRFWMAFLLLTMTLTGFGIHTVALALEAEREQVRQLALMLGLLPHAVRMSEIIEGALIGTVAAAFAAVLYATLSQNMHWQSLLPSGAINISPPSSLSGALLALMMGGGVGACIFAWSPARRTRQAPAVHI